MRLSLRQGPGRSSAAAGPFAPFARVALLLALIAGPAAGVLSSGCNGKKSIDVRADRAKLPAASASASASASGAAAAARDAAAEAHVASGAASYAKYCALCHGPEARGYAADNAPSLRSPTFLSSASDIFLRRSIREGRPGTAMGGYARDLGGPLGEDEIGDIIAFLRSKGPPYKKLPSLSLGGDPKTGEPLYQGLCSGCHGTPDQRRTAVHLANASFLGAATDEYLRFAIVNGRPGTPMQSFSNVLQPSEVDSVIAYVRGWAAPAQVRPKADDVPQGPVVINPKGKSPKFTLREGRYVPAEQVKKALEAKSRIVIIDARSTPDWALARIPGSISVPYYGFARLDDVPKDGTWVVAYCACPHHASGVVVDELRKRGYPNTAVLDEGILEWQRRGYPTDGTGARPPAPPPSGSAAPPPPAPVPAGSVPTRH